MHYYVGFIMRIGTEENMRNGGLARFDASKRRRPASIGHKGPEVDPNFPDTADHDAVCVAVEGKTVFMKCACGRAWSFNDDDEKIIKEEYPGLGLNKFEEIKKFEPYLEKIEIKNYKI